MSKAQWSISRSWMGMQRGSDGTYFAGTHIDVHMAVFVVIVQAVCGRTSFKQPQHTHGCYCCRHACSRRTDVIASSLSRALMATQGLQTGHQDTHEGCVLP